MVNFLLFLSITLNLIAILCIVILYVRQNRFVNLEKDQRKNLEEMEEVISTFITEIKVENEQFLNRLTSFDPNEDLLGKKVEDNKGKAESLEYKPREIKGNKAMLNAYKNVTDSIQENSLTEDRLEKEDVNELLNLILPPEKKQKEKSIVEVAKEMQAEGKSIEDIAKALNKGKTEMELLLKFRQNS
ncbi:MULTISPECIES: hypothetical protein [Niallia]|jgi:hypothetical protein|uniref:Uncharacterized protein n=1 Tax=Niallia circulans TaxID=1397 RepID=A0A268FFX3_NIACI|nr:hypothetical protein [Niallia circulans]AYV66036.1 hypothetical protein C2I06_03625 [Niallia circulans]NRG28665.1 hypothetical protein [Niallia circulans]PAD84264.1 hypothetical protein CHH57_05060 [Niallia circulans]QJX61931.1 hypothetical protein HLK66_09880 [Niallia circulans]UQZ73513.1 hypothetical protein C2I17_02465 [Niallia circulans]